MSQRRLAKELKEITLNPIEKCSAGPVDPANIYLWNGTIIGPDKSPYEGGLFRLEILFSVTYPFKPPTVTFLTKVYHPNITPTGGICLGILKDEWVPSYTINTVLLAVSELLANPNPKDAIANDIAKVYETNRNEFNRIAMNYTHTYA